jgi:H+/Cl- antiporter ClcA
MREFLRKHLLIVIGTIAGAAGGFLYWRFVGCKTGTCPIKSVWYMSTLWGLVMGYLLGSIGEDLIAKLRERRDKSNSAGDTHTDQ